MVGQKQIIFEFVELYFYAFYDKYRFIDFNKNIQLFFSVKKTLTHTASFKIQSKYYKYLYFQLEHTGLHTTQTLIGQFTDEPLIAPFIYVRNVSVLDTNTTIIFGHKDKLWFKFYKN